jgi:hypothetical protein
VAYVLILEAIDSYNVEYKNTRNGGFVGAKSWHLIFSKSIINTIFTCGIFSHVVSGLFRNLIDE